MLEGGFAYGVDVEAYLEQRVMVKAVSAVKDEGGFFHTVVDALKIKIFILRPFG